MGDEAEKAAIAAKKSTSSSESKTEHQPFGQVSKPVEVDLSGLDFKSLSASDPAAVKVLKSGIRSALVTPARREYDIALARLDPKKAIKDRFNAKFRALESAATNIDKMIDGALAEGRPISDIEQIARIAANSYANLENVTAEILAPASSTQAAWGALDVGAGAPGASSAVGGAPAKKGKGKGKGKRK
jgi:hypothetical protein